MINFTKTIKYSKLAVKKLKHESQSRIFENFGICLPKPLKIYYTMSNRCNFRCPMCPHWRWAENDRDEDYISLERMKELIAEMAELGIGELGFSGGEPLLCRDKLFALLEYANRLGIYTHFVTNASLLKLEDLEKYNQIGGGHISISLDAIGGKHDELRGFAGAYAGAAKALELFNGRKFPNLNLKINIVLSGGNLDYAVEVVEKAISVGALVFIQPYDIYDFKNAFNPAERETKFPLWVKKEDYAKLSAVISCLLELKAKHPEIILNDAEHIKAMAGYFSGQKRKGCLAGLDHLIMNEKGEIIFCKYSRIGDLREQSLRQFLASRERKAIVKESLACDVGCLLGCQFRPSLKELAINGPKQLIRLVK